MSNVTIDVAQRCATERRRDRRIPSGFVLGWAGCSSPRRARREGRRHAGDHGRGARHDAQPRRRYLRARRQRRGEQLRHLVDARGQKVDGRLQPRGVPALQLVVVQRHRAKREASRLRQDQPIGQRSRRRAHAAGLRVRRVVHDVQHQTRDLAHRARSRFRHQHDRRVARVRRHQPGAPEKARRRRQHRLRAREPGDEHAVGHVQLA